MIYKIKQNLKIIIMTLMIIITTVSIVIIYYIYNGSTKNIKVKENSNILVKKEVKKEIEKTEEEIYYYVDIKGAVNNEGVYKLKANSRVIDVVNEAGGLKENADTSIINLSKKIFDEMFIIIYTKEEIENYKKETISTKKINDKLEKNILIIDENNNANIKDNSKQKSKTEENEDKTEDKLININEATKEDLLKLTGIGESKAEAIISYREENGDFIDIEDIKNVPGIGDSLFEKIKEYITV